MVGFTTFFFVSISIIAIIYIATTFSKRGVRNLLAEVFFLGIFIIVGLLAQFPQISIFIQETLGIQSTVNFIIYFSIFVAFLLIYSLYLRTEKQRMHITKLTREIAYLKVKHGQKKE